MSAAEVARDQTDMTALAIACAMAFLAGATDICGLSRLHTLFVSFMSGNTSARSSRCCQAAIMPRSWHLS